MGVISLVWSGPYYIKNNNQDMIYTCNNCNGLGYIRIESSDDRSFLFDMLEEIISDLVCANANQSLINNKDNKEFEKLYKSLKDVKSSIDSFMKVLDI
jgi:hypothetical protein